MLAVYFSGSEDMSIDFKQPEINIEPIEILRDLVSRGRKAKALKLGQPEPYASDILCQKFLGWEYYASGDYASARTWFSRASEKNDAESFFGLGSVSIVQEEFQSAFDFFLHAAELGYDRSFYWLGYMYAYGLGVEKDYDMAQLWFKRSSAQGYLVADSSLLAFERNKGGIFSRIIVRFKRWRVLFRTFFIALRNIDDERLYDITPSERIVRFKEKVERILYPSSKDPDKP